MDARDLNMLYECYQEIRQHEQTLHDIQLRFLSPHSLPLYRLRGTIEILQKIRRILRKKIHINERDRQRKMRAEWQELLSERGVTIDTNWCCRCRASSCIYD